MIETRPFDRIYQKIAHQTPLNIPNMDIARRRISELWEVLDNHAKRQFYDSLILPKALLHALSLSPFIHQTLMRHPSFIHKLSDRHLASIPTKRSLAISLGKTLASRRTQDEISIYVRIFRLYHTIRIALRELEGLGTVKDTMKEMSNLADVVVGACLRYSWQTLVSSYGAPSLNRNGQTIRSHFSVIDLGKLGGEELNFSSDIDILYVFDSEKGETQPITKGESLSNAEFYRRLSEFLTRLVSEKTPYGFGFRVDLGLRPDGQYGDIANTLRSMEIYYESWGKLWERAVWIKARHGAGYAPLSQALLATLHPFIYRKYLDFTAIEEIREVKQKIDQESRIRREGEDDIKLGWGGIREIEFFVQAMQLIHGGKSVTLQCRSTLETLQRLWKAGLIPLDEVETLTNAYIFYRRLEHRIQLVHQRQTQRLPAQEEEQFRIAQSLGFTGIGRQPLLNLKILLDGYREKVHNIYENLFYIPSKNATSGVSREIQSIFTENIPSEIAKEWLVENGFQYPERALDIIRRLREGPPAVHYVPKTFNLLNRLMPSLIQNIIASPDPDMAIGYLLSFVEKVGARGTFYALLLENPPVLKLLAKVFGSSRFLSSHLINHPELLDELIHPSHFDLFKSWEQVEKELKIILNEAPNDLESQMDSLRRYKHAEVLRIGINDIYGDMEITGVTDQLSQLAEICLSTAYRIALSVQLRKYSLPDNLNPPFVIIGMGKLGGRELNYSSDLDLIFLFSASNHAGLPDYVDPNEFYGKLAQRFITIMSSPTIEGTLYEIDTRLRPSGTFGPIVTSIRSFKEYHKHSAWFWERQALVKARPITGNQAVFDPVAQTLGEIVYGEPLKGDERGEVLEIRMQMEREIARESSKRIHIKCGYGGLVDIEFLVQYCQIKDGRSFCSVRSPNTLKALEALEETGSLPKGTILMLKDTYLFLRKIENRIQILENRSSPFFNPHGPEMAALARRMGYKMKSGHTAAERLYHDYRAKTKKIREVFTQFIGTVKGKSI